MPFVQPSIYSQVSHSKIAFRRGSALIGLSSLLVALTACAGELQDPDRFTIPESGSAATPGVTPQVPTAPPGGSPGTTPGTPPSPTPSEPPSATPTTPPTPPAEPPPAAPTLPEPPTCFQMLMDTSCGVIGCHPSGASLDLVSAGLGERLLGVEALTAGLCGGEVYVSTDGSSSLLRDKLEAAPSCGSPMPLAGGMLSAEEITCVEAYITSLQEAAQ